MSFVYLASPYSGTTQQMEERYLLAQRAVALFSSWQIAIYSPIVHFHEVAKAHDLPTDAGFWNRMNEAMIRGAKALWVLTADGWEDSAGVTAEIALAERIGKQITYVHALPDGSLHLQR